MTVKQTLNNIINHVMTSEKDVDNSKVSYQREFITKSSNVSNEYISDEILNCMFIFKLMLKDNSNMPVKKMKLDSSLQNTIDCMSYTNLYLLISLN